MISYHLDSLVLCFPLELEQLYQHSPDRLGLYRQPCEFSRETIGHLVVVVVDRRPSVGTDVQIFIPLQDRRARALQLQIGYFLAVDLQHASARTQRLDPATSRGLPIIQLRYSLALLFRMAASSFLMSSGDNCGRSILIVSLLNFAVRGNGGL